MDEAQKEDLGAGYHLLIEDTDDCTERVRLVDPEGKDEIIVGGYESESPEDMTWTRTFESLFYAAFNAGKAVGKSGSG